MSDLLGQAVLELDADLVPLERSLADAKARTALSVATMQSMLDAAAVSTGRTWGRIGQEIDKQLNAPFRRFGTVVVAMDEEISRSLTKVRTEAAATARELDDLALRAATTQEAVAGAAGHARDALLEEAAAAKATGDIGIARPAAGVAVPVGGGSAVFPARAIEALDQTSRAVQSMDAKLDRLHEANARAAGTIWGVRGPNTPGSIGNPIVTVIEAARYTGMGSLAAAIGMSSATAGDTTTTAVTSGGGGSRTIIAPARAAEQTLVAASGSSSTKPKPSEVVIVGTKDSDARVMDALVGAASRVESRQNGAGPSESAMAEMVAAMAAKGRTGEELYPGQNASPKLLAYYQAKGYNAAPNDAGRFVLYGRGGQPGSRNYGASPLAAADHRLGSGGSGGGGDGNSILPMLLWGHGGGGGGGPRLPGWTGAALGAGLGMGAGMGSLASFAGFGAEHIITTAGSVVGSGVSALGGAGLLGLGSLGKFGAGAGSDLAVSVSAITDTAALTKEYEKLREAVAQYGAKSKQAKEAQAEINATMKYALGGTKGAEAELRLAEKVSQMNVNWDKETSGARVAFAHMAEPIIELGGKWIPMVNMAAEKNFGAIKTNMQPLLKWLGGPEAFGIFEQLEEEFLSDIPTGMHATTEAVKFFAKTIAYLAPLSGKFLESLNQFFTKWEEPANFAKWEGLMEHLIGDFHTWLNFAKALGGALVDLFKNDAHTGGTIVETLTLMLERLREWEKSTEGGDELHNLFTQHREEVVDLLKLIGPLVSGFGSIYLTIAPPLVKAVSAVLGGVDKLLEGLEKLGPGADWLVGLTLIAAKLGVLPGILSTVRGAFAATTSSVTRDEAIIATSEQGVIDKTAVQGESGLLSNLGLGKGGKITPGGFAATGVKALAGGGIGFLSASALTSILGIHGSTGNAINWAGLGTGAGLAFGGPFGAAIGAALGGGLSLAVEAFESKGASYGEEVGKRIAKGIVPGFVRGEHLELGREIAQHIAEGVGHYEEASLSHKSILAARKIATESALLGGGGDTQAEQSYNLIHQRALAGAEQQAVAKLAKEARAAGKTVGQEYARGLSEVPDLTPAALLQHSHEIFATLKQELGKVPAVLRNEAARGMIAFAGELEAKGELPKGALRHVVQGLEKEIPGLARFLTQNAGHAMGALSRAMAESEPTLQQALKSAETTFGTTFFAIEGHGRKLVNQSKLTIRELERDWLSGTQTQKADILPIWEKIAFGVEGYQQLLTRATQQHFREMRTAAVTELGRLSKEGLGGSEGALEKWSAAISRDVGSGVISLRRGVNEMNRLLSGELKQHGFTGTIARGFEGKNNPGESLKTSITGGELATPTHQPGVSAPGHATGSWVGEPGERGPDNVLVRLGRGEAVLNHHQQPEVEWGLALSQAMGYGRFGSLGELFKGVQTPHAMASGGIVGFAAGGVLPSGAHHAKSLPKGQKGASAKPVAAFTASLDSLNNQFGLLEHILGPDGTVASLEERFSLENQSDEQGLLVPVGGSYLITEKSPAEVVSDARQLPSLRSSLATAGAPEKAHLEKELSLLESSQLPEPRLNEAAIQQRLGQITPLLKMQGGIREHLEHALALLGPDDSLMRRGIKARKARIEKVEEKLLELKEQHEAELKKLRERIQSNIQAIHAAQKQLKTVEEGKSVAGLETQLQGVEKANAAAPLEKQLENIRLRNLPSGKGYDAARSKQESEEHALEKQIHSLAEAKEGEERGVATKITAAKATQEAEVKKLETVVIPYKKENRQLGGEEESVGTGGEIGKLTKTFEQRKAGAEGEKTKLQAQMGELQEHLTAVREDRHAILGVSGMGGSLGATNLTISELIKQREEMHLKPGEEMTLAKAQLVVEGTGEPEEAKAAEAVAPEGISTGEREEAEEKERNAIELGNLLKQQNEQYSQALYVSQAQYSVLSSLPPFGGSFATGGIVPGPEGAARMILAHGGETVTPKAAATPHVSVHFAEGMSWLKEFVDVRVDGKSQRTSRRASRPLPSAGGAR